MARLYPPITDETFPAFCLTYQKGEKVGATIKINFNLNRAVANSEIDGIALRLRTISTNTTVVSEDLNINATTKKSEGIASSYDLNNGTCIFSITKEYNEEAVEQLKVGQYYKAQIAFIQNVANNDKPNIGYWSTVAVIKCVAEPLVKIANFHASDINIFSNEIVGEYIQDETIGDYTEKVYSYNFQLFDIDGKTILEKTEDKLHNSSQDIKNNASTDIYRCYRELEENEIYYIQYNVLTVNGLKASSPRYQIMNIGSIPPEENIILNAFIGNESSYDSSSKSWLPCEEGVIEIYISLANHNLSKHITGNFVLLRSSSKDNFVTWQEVKRFRLNNEIPSQKKIYDYTVEQGIKYKYAIQQYNRQGFYSNKVYVQNGDTVINPFDKKNAKQIKADFEDMFLYDGKRQLKIRFNPKVASFKNSLQEQKIDTIGSKYPFVFRNGNICYKEFPIAGLISFQEDNAQFFITENDYQQMDLDRFNIPFGERKQRYQSTIFYVPWNPAKIIKSSDLPIYQVITKDKKVYDIDEHHEINTKYLEPIEQTEIINYQRINNISEANQLRRSGVQLYTIGTDSETAYTDIYRGETYNQTDLTSDNIMSERYFKLSVLDWLTDGKPKLFRSPTEGNYIVRLLNVSLTPKTELGRMLHEFSCTAYEIAEFNYDSLVEFGLLSVEEPSELETQWTSYHLRNLYSDYKLNNKNLDPDGYYLIDINYKEIKGFECSGFAPGDKLKIILVENPEPLIITIGQTGSYIYKDGELISSISILPKNDTKDFPRDLFIEALGYTYQKFDMIASINMYTQKGEQIIGKSDNIFEKTVVGLQHKLADKISDQNPEPYETANNVYLSETFTRINSEDINETIYKNNIYYKFDPKKNIYYLPINSSGKKEAFNPSIDYYKRNLVGEKIITTDILYLHAKKREIIPIFLASKNHYFLDNLNLNTGAYFMLTPFGNGYVRQKSISPYFQWQTKYGSLLENTAERTEALTIHDLIQFFITKCYGDEFCLFQVYVPHNTNDSTIWEPYDPNYYLNAKYSGIFDPYLYHKQKDGNDKNYNTRNWPGWWTIDEQYNPSFYLTYGEDGNKQIEEISLNNNIEIILKDIKMPSDLRVGNGVSMELFYRLKYIDYTIENENKKLKTLKDNYLQTSQLALQNKSIYRKQLYFKKISDAAANIKENEIDVAVNNTNYDYVNTIKRLAELSRKAEIANIKRYLLQEKNIVWLFLNRLDQIDESLRQELGEDDSIFYNLYFIPLKDKYEAFINEKEELSDDKLLFIINDYEIKKASLQKTLELLQSYYNNIQKSGSQWNFINITNQVLKKLNDSYTDIQEEIEDLDENIYVGQYLEELKSRGLNLFFYKYSIQNDINDFNFNINSSIANYPIGEWIHKIQPNLNILSTYNLLDSRWKNYFHVGEEDKELPTLSAIPQKSSKTYKYSIDNLDKYLPENVNNKLNINPSTSKLYTLKFQTLIDNQTKNESLVLIINDLLAKLNSQTGAQTQEQYKNKWGIDWTSSLPGPISQLLPEENETYSSIFSLGAITVQNNIYTIKKSKLEKTIDSGFSSGALTNSSNQNDIQRFLKNSYGTFPDVLVTSLAQIIYNYIVSGIRNNFQDIYDFYVYRNTNPESLTENQKNFIQQQLRIYIEELNTKDIWNSMLNFKDESSQLYQFVFGNQNNTVRNFKEWYIDWNNIKNPESLNDQISELKNYITIFNKVITEKNHSILQFKAIKKRIANIEKDSSIKPSDNMKTILFNKENSYYTSYQTIKEELNFLTTRLSILQKSLDYQGYLDFLDKYLQLLNNTDIKNQDENYSKFLKQITKMKDQPVIEENNPNIQHLKVTQAWKNFLEGLAIAYRDIEKTGRLS